MADDQVSATTLINAPAQAIFAVLADPAKHAAIDGTGWVREPLDAKPLTTAGQIFRMSMGQFKRSTQRWHRSGVGRPSPIQVTDAAWS